MKWRCSFIFLFVSLTSVAQKDSSQKTVTFNIHYGQIYAHSVLVRNVKGAKPFQAEVEFSRQRMNQSTFEQCNCYPKAGFQLSYISFGTGILGDGIALSHFLEPQYLISPNLQFRIKGAIGAIYLTKPFDPLKNPTNNSYAIHLNPYFSFGSGIAANVGDDWNIGLMGFFHHTSNSGIKQPNRGINWLTGALSLQYSSAGNKLPRLKRTYDRYWKGKQPTFEAGLFYSPSQGFNARQGMERNYVIGGFVQAIKQVSRVSGLIMGSEVYYNSFEQHLQPLSSATVVSLQGGHVFLLNRASLTTQIGIDVFNETVTKSNFFTRWGFNYKLSDHIRAGASLKAQADYADFADIRLSYIF